MFTNVVEWIAHADDDALLAELRRTEAVRREHAAREAAVLSELERRKVYRRGGHATMHGLLRSNVQWSDVECRDRMRLARLVDEHHEVGDALYETRVSVANAVEIARVHAIDRLDDAFHGAVGQLLRLAERLEHVDLRERVRTWEVANDPREAADESVASHEARDAHVHQGPEGGELAARFGTVDAAEIAEIFAMYVEAEWRTDWDATVGAHADAASVALMPRTGAQRRADALRRIFLDAASKAPGSKAPEPVVNIHIDHRTFTDLMVEAELFPERKVDPFDDPTPHVSQLLCRTDHGQVVDPHTVLQHLLESRVRFVIRNEQGVPIRWGRARRLFEGAARDAVRSLSTRCTHPGCRVPTRRSDIDHALDHASGGPTDPDNGNVRCRRHNLLKNRGFTVHRDALGEWRTYHPDGTPVA